MTMYMAVSISQAAAVIKKIAVASAVRCSVQKFNHFNCKLVTEHHTYSTCQMPYTAADNLHNVI